MVTFGFFFLVKPAFLRVDQTCEEEVALLIKLWKYEFLSVRQFTLTVLDVKFNKFKRAGEGSFLCFLYNLLRVAISFLVGLSSQGVSFFLVMVTYGAKWFNVLCIEL